jgi:hypothetical protein
MYKKLSGSVVVTIFFGLLSQYCVIFFRNEHHYSFKKCLILTQNSFDNSIN